MEDSKTTTIAEAYFAGSTKSEDFLCGVEYEIEDIRDIYLSSSDFNVFIQEEDGSLRNNGKEFKTIPSSYEETLTRFKLLHSKLKLGKAAFSHRTSIHVHVNVRSFTEYQLKQMILTYALYEPLFLRYVGPERTGSIFCVPLNHTYLPGQYQKTVESLISSWHKYTAFNIVPVGCFGTVEFRHMYGTADYNLFKDWIDSLRNLWAFIDNDPKFDLLESFTNENSVAELAVYLFPVFTKGLSTSDLNVMMADTLIDVKLSKGGV